MSQRYVRGFHGTTRSSAAALIQSVEVPKLSERAGNWLGNGFYFFEEYLEMASSWPLEQVSLRARLGWFDSPAVLVADIELSDCADLCMPTWHAALSAMAQGLSKSGSLPQQFGPELESAGGKLFNVEDYTVAARPGLDPLDHFADAAAINALVEDLVASGQSVSSVRAAFTAGAQSFPNSHLFRDTHIQIAVRDPARVIRDLRLIPPA